MKRVPLLPTILMLFACGAMVKLGLWQLQRHAEKRAQIALFQTNQAISAEAMFPTMGPVPDASLFRQSRATCLEPVNWRAMAGRSLSGQSGFRQIAACKTGAEGPGFLADMGVSPDPRFKPDWRGGEVAGMIALDPETPSLLSRMFKTSAPPLPMLVSAAALPGLKPSAHPSVEDVPNNHLAYAVQWFLFAAIAALIYLLALRKRLAETPRKSEGGDEPPKV